MSSQNPAPASETEPAAGGWSAAGAHPPEVSARQARRRGVLYIAEHRIKSMRGYLWTILIAAFGQPVIYLFGLGIGLATVVDRGSGMGQHVAGDVGYLTFVAPALLASATMMTSTEEFTYPIMDGFKWRRMFYGPHASPVSTNQLVDGLILGTFARLAGAAVVYYLIMAGVGAVPRPWTGALMVPGGLLCGLAFGTWLMAFSAHIEEERGQFPLLMRFVIMPLFLFSGTFFPLANLPVYLHWIGWLSPLWHACEFGRVVAYGMAEPVWLTAVHVVYPAALAIAGWLVTRHLFARRLGR